MTLEETQKAIITIEQQIINLQYEHHLASAALKQAEEGRSTTLMGSSEIEATVAFLKWEAPVVLLSEWQNHNNTLETYRYLLAQYESETKRHVDRLQKAEASLIVAQKTLKKLMDQVSSLGTVLEMYPNEHRRDPPTD